MKRFPGPKTIYKWLRQRDETGALRYPYFEPMWRQAREISADALIDQTLSIADLKGKDVSRDKLRVDTRFRLAGKLKPEAYGDRVTHDHSVAVTHDVADHRHSARAVAELLEASGLQVSDLIDITPEPD